MAEVKRKAEILDKLEEMFETSANANRKHGFNGGAEFYERYLDIIRSVVVMWKFKEFERTSTKSRKRCK